MNSINCQQNALRPALFAMYEHMGAETNGALANVSPKHRVTGSFEQSRVARCALLCCFLPASIHCRLALLLRSLDISTPAYLFALLITSNYLSKDITKH